MRKSMPLLANIASQVLFGLAFYFIKMGMAVVDQNTVKFLSFRFGLGFIAMTAVWLLGLQKTHYREKKGMFWMILVCGLFNPMISQILETSSTTYAPTSQIALYNSLLPIVMIGFSALINREYPTKRQLLFVVLGVAGVLVANLADKPEGAVSQLGMALIVGTIIVIAVQRVLLRRASAVFTSFEIIYVTTGMGAAWFTALSLGSHMMAAPLSTYFDGLLCPEFAISILYMGICSCVFAFLLMTYAAANLPFAVYSATSTLSTAISIVAGVALLGETFRPVEALGTVIILLSIVGMSLSYDKNKDNRMKVRNR